MNTANLKTYAPQARKDFLVAVTNRALKLGISEKGNAEVIVQGDLMLIGGTAYPRFLGAQRNQLIAKIKDHGFAHVMEEAAYTWFNRFMAIRYMEVHGYFAHGYRVLSNPSGGNQPEILQHPQNVDIPGLDKKRVVELLSQGNQQEELYRTLILAQSKALGQAMPFLFDTIDTSTEILLPDGLLAPQSVVRKLVGDIPEADWQSTEILGWLYQFYVSEEKKRVDDYVKKGQAVEPEDIPAKTQLFTPNWIVQFLTQNSLGRLWMDVYPDSSLREKMPYYTHPAEQKPEVAARLREVTPDSLDPKTLTAIDPAAGSGHILLELYNLFFTMYQERGYRVQDIPRLILENNLYGLELDRRAAQIAGFAVLMRARADDPGLLENPPKVNVTAIRSSRDLDAAALLTPKQVEELFPNDQLFEPDQPKLVASGRPLFSDATIVGALKELFAESEVIGSLQRIPEDLAAKLGAFAAEVERVRRNANLMENEQLALLAELVHQAQMLARRYTVTAMNPPYMGGRGLCKDLKAFLNDNYGGAEKDVFAAFMARSLEWTQEGGYMGFMSPFTWMFISTFESLRRTLIDSTQLSAWIQLEYSGFEGATVPVCTFTLRNWKLKGEKGSYIRLSDFKGAENQAPRTLEAIQNPNCGWLFRADQDEFKKIPGWPIAYWVTESVRAAYMKGQVLNKIADPCKGIDTGENGVLLRLWHEVDFELLSVSRHDQSRNWVPYNKGGEFRRWYGNREWIVNYSENGKELRMRQHWDQKKANLRNETYWFRPCFTWTSVSSGGFSARYSPEGALFDNGGSSVFAESNLEIVGALLNSSFANACFEFLSPTLNFQPGDVGLLPAPTTPIKDSDEVVELVRSLVQIFKTDWDDHETSWDFSSFRNALSSNSISACWKQQLSQDAEAFDLVMSKEQRLNEIVLGWFEMDSSSIAEVTAARISLSSNPAFTYKERRAKLNSLECDESDNGEAAVVLEDSNELLAKRKIDWARELLSYSIGTIMGRYSLDEPGLIYAYSGGEGFDPSRYRKFPADQDGILPITDDDFFGEEDTANRFEMWIKTVWPNTPTSENLEFIADALGRRATETALEAIRRYLATDFFKDHLQTYKKRPIYWLFSSGKHRAFQALVYLHRYNESTLSAMLNDYVTPLFGKLSARIHAAESESQKGSTSERKAATKKLEKLRAQQVELTEFEAKLRHYALQRISLDLDDGVKVNYGKFGDILAKVKEITGGKDE